MAFQTFFKRHELKYLITQRQAEAILNEISPYMEPDRYGKTTVRNLYFDTDSFRLIRRSVEKPLYKEKLRVRSYERASADSTVFVELKKKYESVVYKRRIALREAEAMGWLCKSMQAPTDTQIAREIDYFMKFYGEVKPTVFLSYERQAYKERNGLDLRITFDRNVLFRQTDLSLCSEVYGESILNEDTVLMEIKSSGGIPLPLVRVLSREKIYKTSFSKYGTAYERVILPRLLLENNGRKKENFSYASNIQRLI